MSNGYLKSFYKVLAVLIALGCATEATRIITKKESIVETSQSYVQGQGQISGIEERTNEQVVDNECCKVKESIKIKITGSDGVEYYLDKGLFKDRLGMEETFTMDISNTSGDCDFEGGITFSGLSLFEQLGNFEIYPNGIKPVKVALDSGDLSYQVSGGMRKVFTEIDSYYPLIAQTTNKQGEQLSVNCAIAIPEGFEYSDSEKILKEVITNYKNEDVVSISIYICPEGTIISDNAKMFEVADYMILANKYQSENLEYGLYNMMDEDALIKGALK